MEGSRCARSITPAARSLPSSPRPSVPSSLPPQFRLNPGDLRFETTPTIRSEVRAYQPRPATRLNHETPRITGPPREYRFALAASKPGFIPNRGVSGIWNLAHLGPTAAKPGSYQTGRRELPIRYFSPASAHRPTGVLKRLPARIDAPFGSRKPGRSRGPA